MGMKKNKKKLMILGAGINQLPAIKKAVELGYFVITVDYLPQNVGHKYSHQYVNCSTMDKERVLRIAKELNIDGIVTFASDVATSTVGFVVRQIGIPGAFAAEAQEIMSNKSKFRIHQKRHGLNRPDFIVGSSYEEIEKLLLSLKTPLMFKPVDTSGSRGISRVYEINNSSCVEAFEIAKRFSHTEIVIVEEFIEGTEVGGDGFLKNGKLKFAIITQKHTRNFVVTGHRIPTDLSIGDQERVIEELNKTCDTIGYTDGPINYDVIVTNEKITIMELSPRLGGNGIPMIVERSTGFDIIGTSILFALNEDISFPKAFHPKNSCGSLVFGSEQKGVSEHILTKDELAKAVPEVFEFSLNFNIGEIVPIFKHCGNSIGYVLFDCPVPSIYLLLTKKIEKTLNIIVSESWESKQTKGINH